MNLELNNLTEKQKNQIIELAKKFEQENEVDKLDYNNDWKPYGCIGSVNQVYGMNRGVAGDLFELGLTAHTKEEAEKIRRRLLVEKELRDWAKKCKNRENARNADKMKHALAYNAESNCVITNYFYDVTESNIIFTDFDTARQAIKSIGQERLIRDYFGIDK